MQPKHVTVALFLALVGLVAGQWGRVRWWFEGLRPVQQYLWILFALVLTLGIIARHSVDAMIWVFVSMVAAVVGYVFYLVLKTIAKL